MRQLRVLGPCLLLLTGCFDAGAQAVISTHSGVINFSEGLVFVDDRPVDQKPGSFPSVKEGSSLRTEGGRVEVLLTPGVVLRIDESSAIRMLSTSISDTKLELLSGSAIVDAKDAATTDGVTVSYKGYRIRFPERGVYRLNSEPGVLQAYAGRAEVSGEGQAPVTIDDSNQFFFDIGMKTDKLGDGTVDRFSEWARGRSETMTADNAAAAASSGDPGDLNNGGYSTGDPGLYSGVPSLGVPSWGGPGYGSLSGIGPLNNGLYSSYPSPYPFLNSPYGQVPPIVILGGWGYGRSPYRSGGYPTWSATGRPRPMPVHPMPVRALPMLPVHPLPGQTYMPGRNYATGAYSGSGVNRATVRPSPVLPSRPVMIHPAGRR